MNFASCRVSTKSHSYFFMVVNCPPETRTTPDDPRGVSCFQDRSRNEPGARSQISMILADDRQSGGGSKDTAVGSGRARSRAVR